jgi:hypothetical protein
MENSIISKFKNQFNFLKKKFICIVNVKTNPRLRYMVCFTISKAVRCKVKPQNIWHSRNNKGPRTRQERNNTGQLTSGFTLVKLNYTCKRVGKIGRKVG